MHVGRLDSSAQCSGSPRIAEHFLALTINVFAEFDKPIMASARNKL